MYIYLFFALIIIFILINYAKNKESFNNIINSDFEINTNLDNLFINPSLTTAKIKKNINKKYNDLKLKLDIPESNIRNLYDLPIDSSNSNFNRFM